jgi:uncharacterized protein (TIGR00730 family)
MSPEQIPHQYTTHNPSIDAQIASLLGSIEEPLDRRLLVEMMTSVYRLGQERSSTGDLKILNVALKELRYAFKVFRPYRDVRKVALFGSARLPRHHPAYAMAKTFGSLMARAGWMVITGAASGVMKAGHEGAGRTASFGLNIRLPFEQAANPIIAKDNKLISCKYFFTRKLLFIKESHATALFPGGFGTLDEGFESLTLVQTGKSDARPIVFVDVPGGKFWRALLKFFDRQLVDEGMISSTERSIYQLARSAEEAAKIIQHFYSTYHSQRYVKGYLVIRLQRRLLDASVASLSREFRDMLSGSVIRQSQALSEEADEPELDHLPRLVLKFDRQHYGRLIEFIHRINDLGQEDRHLSPGTDRSCHAPR